MTTANQSELGLCLLTLVAFTWGMLRFFRKPTRDATSTRVVAVLGLASAAWDVWAIATAVTDWRRGVIASTLFVAATTLFFASVRAARRARLTAIFAMDVPEVVLRDGPYCCLRHPFYVAYSLFWLGAWIASNSFASLLAALLMCSIYAHAARQEERKFAESRLADAYDQYRRQTGLVSLCLHFAASVARATSVILCPRDPG
jgi:protein-S-isoprenylcysteine O-methyltransferase Ste14